MISIAMIILGTILMAIGATGGGIVNEEATTLQERHDACEMFEGYGDSYLPDDVNHTDYELWEMRQQMKDLSLQLKESLSTGAGQKCLQDVMFAGYESISSQNDMFRTILMSGAILSVLGVFWLVVRGG